MANTHAIVVGGSMAGLCAARVLSGFYDKVTVIDRDAYPVGAHERPGVPQSRHVHALLMRGRIELDRLFPGFERTMIERGAIDINFGLDFAALRVDGWSERRANNITTLFASRVLIEATVRELLRKVANVELIERAEAVGFETVRGDSIRVSGVKVNPRDGAAAFVLTGDLIVDASGRATKIPSWIEAMGLPMPPETVVDSHTGYASRWYKVNPERRPKDWWWKGIWIDPVAVDASTAGVLFPIEGNRMIVSLAGIGGNYPPSDEAEFTAKLAQLRSPIIAEEVALAEPLSQVYSYRQMANRWRHYDKWARTARRLRRARRFVVRLQSRLRTGDDVGRVVGADARRMSESKRRQRPRTAAKILRGAGALPGRAVGTRDRLGFQNSRHRRQASADESRDRSANRQDVRSRQRRSGDRGAYRRSDQYDEAAEVAVRAVDAEDDREGMVAAG